MVTDPVKQSQVFTTESDLVVPLRPLLRELAALPPSLDAPYLTVTLDWRPQGTRPGREPAPEPKRSQMRGGEPPQDGSAWRASWEQMERDLRDVVDQQEAHSAARESLERDLEKIGAYLDDLDPAARGVFITACSAKDVFQPVAVSLPLPSRYSLGPTPALSALARLADDYPTFAVLVADQREANLSFVRQASVVGGIELTSTLYPAKQQQGGWSQRRFQARADERVEAFAGEIAEQMRAALDDLDVDRIVIAASEPMKSALNEAFHETVSDRVAGWIALDGDANDAQMIEAAWPVIEQAEREREQAAVQQVQDNLGPGDVAAAGADDVVAALLSGQVMTLVMTDDFSAEGWADFTQGVAGSGAPPTEHPYGGDPADLVPVALEEELLRLAYQSDAAVEIVSSESPISAEDLTEIPDADSPRPRSEAATALDGLGGIGAVLRFALSEEQATADLDGSA